MPARQGLYDPANEKDACGVGFVAHIKSRKSHDIVEKGLTILRNLTHRGATGYDPKLGDGAGMLIQLPDAFLRKETARLGISLPEAGQYAVGMVHVFVNGRQVIREGGHTAAKPGRALWGPGKIAGPKGGRP